MRKLIALLTIFSLNAYAVAPTGVGGEQGSLSYTNNLKAPNYQITSLGGVNSRIESGNTNLLMNPSFEHTTVYTGWTINGGTTSPFSNATVTENTTNQVEGKKAVSIAPSAALLMTQDSTVNAANLTGLQGVASVKIKATGTTGLKVCPRNAGAAVANLCVNVTADNTWKHISIPFILTATSNGIGIATTATGGTVIIDDAFVGTSAPFQDVSGSRLVGSVTVTGCTALWSTTSASYASFATQTGCSYATTGSASAPSTNIPAIKFASLPAGDYRIEYEGALIISSSSTVTGYYQFTDGTNLTREQSAIQVGPANNSGAPSISQTISYSTAQSNVTFEVKAKTSSGTAYIGGSTAQPGTFKVWYFPPATKIYSQASQDVAFQSCTFSSLAWTGLGTITNNLLCARKGQNLIIKGKWRTGTVTASTASIPLPTNFGSIAVSSSIGALQVFGMGFRDTSSAGAGYVYHAAGSSTSLSISPSLFNSATNPLTQASGSTTFASSEMQHIPEISIPIEGWQDYGVIVGSFAGLEKCANDYECTDTFSAQVSSTGVVSNENIDWINGNCVVSGTSVYTCTLISTLKDGTSGLSSTMNCVADPVFSGGQLATIQSASTSTIVVEQRNSTDASLRAAPFNIKCQKGSQDYKPKTAKVAVPATETFVSYWLSANFAASTTTPINFDSVEFDNCSPSCVTTSATAWKFTAKYSGTYQVILKQNIPTATTVVSSIFINGTKIKNVAISANGAYTFGSAIVRMNAGDYLDIRPDISVSYSGGVLSGSFTNVSVSRLGNQ